MAAVRAPVVYRVEFCEGYSATGHFGAEVALACHGNYTTLDAARAALARALARHRERCGHARGYDIARIDIVASDGRRFRREA